MHTSRKLYFESGSFIHTNMVGSPPWLGRTQGWKDGLDLHVDYKSRDVLSFFSFLFFFFFCGGGGGGAVPVAKD